MTIPDGTANDPVHELDTDELVERYDEFVDLVRYGDPDAVTARDKRKFERMQVELLSRIAKEVLDIE